MRTIVKIIVAAALTGTAAAPAFAYETALEFQTQLSNSGAPAPHVMKKTTRALRNDALGAMAHEPAGPLPAYDRNFRDFGIGSQS
jgi:hypothetical protein